MNPIAFTNRRLSACALAVAALSAQNVFALDITANVSGNYTAGTVGATNVVTIAPSAGAGVTFSGDLQLAVGPATATTLNINATRNMVDGQFSTNGQTMNFQVSPDALHNFDVKNGLGTGQVTVRLSSGTGLVVTGGESVGLTLTGSLKNGATVLLINNSNANSALSGVYDQREANSLITDNSYVINSHVWSDDNDLRYTANRFKNEYIVKSGTQGHFSNPAALALGTIAFEGSQAGDLVTVIDHIDLDGYGYGNNLSNLAFQMKRLAPIANSSYTLSALSASSQLLASTDDRLSSLRGDVPAIKLDQNQSVWARATVSTSRQAAVDAYDGYQTNFQGVSIGADRKIGNGWLGAALSVGSSDIDQVGFRTGDHAGMNNVQLSAYGALEAGAFYMDGAMATGLAELTGKRATAIDRVADAHINMSSTEFKFGLGHRVKFQDGKSTLTPNVSLLMSSLTQNEYTETGAGDLGLHFDEKTFKRTRTSMGLKFNTEGHLAGKMAYSNFYLNLSRDAGLDNLDVTANYSGQTTAPAATFTTDASQFVRNSVQLGGGVSLAMSKTSSLQVRYELDHRQAFNSHGLQIKSLWKF